jgi:hypothetical protein
MGQHPASRRLRRRGVAMVLVMLAVAIGVVLSCAYLTGQSTSATVAGNAGSKAQARAVAESALGMAMSYVRTHDDWRTAKAPGQWASDQPLAGGTFTVRGDDGEDTNGDGVVEGDGSFTNDTMDMLTLTATGRYRGTEHTVRAVVPPFKQAAMIVPNPVSLATEDTDRYTLLRNWGWRVRLLKAAGTNADYDTAVAGVHVIYAPAHSSLGATILARLASADLPIVSENMNLVTTMKVASTASRTWSGTSMDVLQLTRTVTDDAGNESTQAYTHYITSVSPVGVMAVCGQSATLLYVQGASLGAQTLATRTGQPTQPALAVLEAGALQTDGHPALARRVILPWGGASNTFAIGSLNSNGHILLRRSLDWAGSSWRGPLPGIAVWDKLEVKDMGLVDGYNSASGPYGGANVNSLPVISTNSLLSDGLKVSGGLVKGNAFVSPLANLGQVLDVSAGASLTGVQQNLSLNVPIPTPEPPAGMGSSIGDRTYSSGTYTALGDVHFGKLTITGAGTVRVRGATRIYCDQGLTIDQSGALTLRNSSASLLLYTAGPVTIRGSGALAANMADPTKVRWFVLKGAVQLQDDARVYAQAQTFDGTLTVGGNSLFYGTFLGKRATIGGSGAFHVDTSNSAILSNLVGGFDLARVVSAGVRWVEMR